MTNSQKNFAILTEQKPNSTFALTYLILKELEPLFENSMNKIKTVPDFNKILP